MLFLCFFSVYFCLGLGNFFFTARQNRFVVLSNQCNLFGESVIAVVAFVVSADDLECVYFDRVGLPIGEEHDWLRSRHHRPVPDLRGPGE